VGGACLHPHCDGRRAETARYPYRSLAASSSLHPISSMVMGVNLGAVTPLPSTADTNSKFRSARRVDGVVRHPAGVWSPGDPGGSCGWLCKVWELGPLSKRRYFMVPCVAGIGLEWDASPNIHLTQRAAPAANAASPPRNNMFAPNRNMRYRVKRSFTLHLTLICNIWQSQIRDPNSDLQLLPSILPRAFWPKASWSRKRWGSRKLHRGSSYFVMKRCTSRW